jgi:hypothetical protein
MRESEKLRNFVSQKNRRLARSFLTNKGLIYFRRQFPKKIKNRRRGKRRLSNHNSIAVNKCSIYFAICKKIGEDEKGTLSNQNLIAGNIPERRGLCECHRSSKKLTKIIRMVLWIISWRDFGEGGGSVSGMRVNLLKREIVQRYQANSVSTETYNPIQNVKWSMYSYKYDISILLSDPLWLVTIIK